MRADFLIGCDQRRVIVRFRVGDDQEIEGIARPCFEEGGFRDVGERPLAYLNADLHAELLREIERSTHNPPDLLQEAQLDQDRRGDQKIVLIDRVESPVGEPGKIVLAQPDHHLRVEVGDQVLKVRPVFEPGGFHFGREIFPGLLEIDIFGKHRLAH
jgi:hypothetical protein